MCDFCHTKKNAYDWRCVSKVMFFICLMLLKGGGGTDFRLLKGVAGSHMSFCKTMECFAWGAHWHILQDDAFAGSIILTCIIKKQNYKT